MPRGVRAEAIKDERRRRRPETLDRIHGLKLAIPAEFRDDQVHTYRWINDVNQRVTDLTKDDDWNICVPGGAEGSQEDGVRRVVETRDGKPVYAYLARKRKDWYDADKKAASARNDAREDAFLKRPETDPSDPRASATLYVAKGSSIKRRGAYAP